MKYINSNLIDDLPSDVRNELFDYISLVDKGASDEVDY